MPNDRFVDPRESREAAEVRARERWKRENRSDVDLVFEDE